MVAAQRWPVHPLPLPDETLSSWLTRLARANGSSASSWIASLDGRYRDAGALDTTSDLALWKALRDGAGLTGSPEEVRAMTLLDLVERLEPHAARRWLLAVDDRVHRARHGYCPVCLAADTAPYLRRAWRLEWVRFCPAHACRLEDKCSACEAPLSPWRVAWTMPFTSCWKCGRDLARRPPRGVAAYAKAPAFVLDAIRQALAQSIGDVPGQGASPFSAVWCLQKWAEKAGRGHWPSWLTRLNLGTALDATPPSDEDAVAWSFALGWHLATGAPERLSELALRHQSTFNRATMIHCPPELRHLRRPVYPTRNVTPADVEEVVASLIEGDLPVTYVAVAEALSISPNRIGGHATLRATVDRAAPVLLARWCKAMRARLGESRDRLRVKGARLSRARLAADAGVSLEAVARFERETGETFAVSPSDEYANLISGAIAALRERGERITTTAVARHLGRERSFIEKNPDLRLMVRAARDARPTPEEVHRACESLHARGDAVTSLGVARLLGRGRHTIERSESLRAIVREHRMAVQRDTEHAIRDAIRGLRDEGKAITLAAVCRVLGRSRSYVEVRGRLDELVRAAARSRAEPH